jgi:hypothetical protein
MGNVLQQSASSQHAKDRPASRLVINYPSRRLGRRSETQFPHCAAAATPSMRSASGMRMEKRRYTRSEVIDAIVAEAQGLFKGHKRDGKAPAITVQNFTDEMFRYGARALRARLSQLSHAELLGEAAAAVAHRAMLDSRYNEGLQLLVSGDREAAAQALRQRQAELARRPRLQPAILAAACHYRAHGKNAKQAWDAIKESPFKTGGEVVLIEEETMRVQLPDGTQKRRGIEEAHWQKRYWPAAKKLIFP